MKSKGISSLRNSDGTASGFSISYIIFLKHGRNLRGFFASLLTLSGKIVTIAKILTPHGTGKSVTLLDSESCGNFVFVRGFWTRMDPGGDDAQ